MKKIYMINNAFWKIYLLIIITFFSPCLFSCTEHKDVEATIFDDVIQMDAEYGNGNFVFFNVPSGVEYLILGIFANPIEVDGKNIVNTY
ncbi:MAG: hypothetical protein SVR08_06500, partial [Spirochaetota bacterium]|nr:hypothetical protein [Spirochaetota bacterium]